ncbi:hypothetical protein HPB49_010184 [Dermacentor silvarum]|uniref:Uncharacterized protein n=1 Tax=Dermacentor silvarum TaxID=543639 RepID=A0ACB8CKC8_DERSI|nr:hypothetical protein HPB49_010184 [Dermacentor silvarum]
MDSRPTGSYDWKEAPTALHHRWSSNSAENASSPRTSASKTVIADDDLLPRIDEIPAAPECFAEPEMVHRVETCLNRRQPLFEAAYPADATGRHIFSSRPPSSFSAKEVLYHKMRDGERHSCVSVNEQCRREATSDLNSAVGTPHQPLDTGEASVMPDERSSSSLLHRTVVFSAVNTPPSRLESASKRVPGKLSRALLQVDSVSVQYGNRLTAGGGIFRRLFGGCKPLGRTRLPGYLHAKNSGSSVGRCRALPFTRPHQSLRVLLTVAFLLAAFVLASGLFASKLVDDVSQRDKDMRTKRRQFEEHVADNITGDDGSRGGKLRSAFKAMGAHRRSVVLNDELVYSGVVTSFGRRAKNWTELLVSKELSEATQELRRFAIPELFSLEKLLQPSLFRHCGAFDAFAREYVGRVGGRELKDQVAKLGGNLGWQREYEMVEFVSLRRD